MFEFNEAESSGMNMREIMITHFLVMYTDVTS